MTITKNWVLIQLKTQGDKPVVDVRVRVYAVKKDLRNTVIRIELADSFHVVNKKSPIAQLPTLILLERKCL